MNTRPIILTKDENGMYIPQYANGFNEIILPSKAEELIKGLSDYCMIYCDEEIEEYNNREREEYYKHIYSTSKTEKQKRNNKGFIYVLECSNKYKIGFSKNVEHRVKQLDTRPFEIKLLKKYYSDRAYDLEQEVHKRLEAYKISNEWYDNITVDVIIETIIETARIIGCDIQY